MFSRSVMKKRGRGRLWHPRRYEAAERQRIDTIVAHSLRESATELLIRRLEEDYDETCLLNEVQPDSLEAAKLFAGSLFASALKESTISEYLQKFTQTQRFKEMNSRSKHAVRRIG